MPHNVYLPVLRSLRSPGRTVRAPVRVRLGLLAALGLLLPGCSGPGRGSPAFRLTANPDQARGTVDVWSWNIAAKSLQRLTPAFRKRYPAIRPKVEMTGANVEARLLLSLASDVGAPDVCQLQCEEALRYIETGRLTDLTPVAARYEKDFPPALWHNCVMRGHVYAIPWDMGPCAVYYKRNLFQKYGVDPRSLSTWDDFIAAGERILRGSGGHTRMLVMDEGAPVTMFQLLLQQTGGQVFDDRGRIAVNSAQSRQVLGLMRRIIQSGIGYNVKMWGQEFMAGLNTDTVATYPEAAWFAGTIQDAVPDYGGVKQSWGVFRLPAISPGGLRTSNLGGSVLVIPRQCPNKAAAWAFIRYSLCTSEGQLQLYRYADLFPAYLPALDSPLFDQPDPLFGGQRIGRLFARSATGMQVLNRTANWTEATQYINEALSRWIDQGMRDPHVLGELSDLLHRRLDVPIAPMRAPRAR